jgi:hypothetical protein
MTLWEIVLMVVVLKIPVAYVLWVIWWAIRAEPEVGTEGGTEGVNWSPWRRRGPRPLGPERSAPRGLPTRPGSRGSRERQRARTGRATA